MSSEREPMWYCHQCNAEMRPLMAPEPRCSSCQGSFVEKMENPADDPREFHQADFGIPNTALDFFALLLARSQEPRNSSSDTNHGSPRSSAGPFGQRALRVEFGNSNGRSTFVFGGPHVLLTGNRDSDRESETSGSNPPRLQDFVRAHASDDRGSNVPGYPIAQNLLALLTRGPLGLAGINNLSETPGRMGDFVFTQDALDQILTQIMEQSSANRPVPAPEEVVEKLPRTVLEDGDALLENDCAVCKEQFDSKAEDASEQIVITLPCKHVFHEGCILPWLKSSGTCPVCRFALVPQPNSSPREPGPSSSSSSGSSPPHSGVPPSPRMRRSSNESDHQFFF